MKDKYIIGILGGMGPMAGVTLQEKIILHTKSEIDQDHLRIIHFSFASDIQDRTNYLLNNPKDSHYLDKIMKLIYNFISIGKSLHYPVILGIPCNTFHSPCIFNMFSQNIQKLLEDQNITPNEPGYIHIINMIDETVLYIQQNHFKKVGLLSTSGTRDTKVYESRLLENNIKLIEVPLSDQCKVQELIYNLKKKSARSEYLVNQCRQFIDYLKKKGANCIIFGCTELGILLDQFDSPLPVINPIEILAKKLISMTNKSKLKDE